MWLNIAKLSHSSRVKMSASNRGEDETPQLFTPSEYTTSSKRSVLRKKLRAEKLALELKIAEQTCANELECEPREKETCESSIVKGQAELKISATVDPSVQASKIDQLFEKMLSAFVKIVNQTCRSIMEIH